MQGLLLFFQLFTLSTASMLVGYCLRDIMDWAKRRYRTKSTLQPARGTSLRNVLKSEPDCAFQSPDRPFEVRNRETGMLFSRHATEAEAIAFRAGRCNKEDLVILGSSTGAQGNSFILKHHLMPGHAN